VPVAGNWTVRRGIVLAAWGIEAKLPLFLLFDEPRGTAHLETRPVAEWEYRKIDLNQQHPRRDDIDILNVAGADGWELVGITSNNMAYLKRLVEDAAPGEEEYGTREVPAVEDANGVHRDDAPKSSHEVKIKYRDPKTNETWTGRGRMATWLKRKQDAGEDIEKYLV
jgi:H-NS histone family